MQGPLEQSAPRPNATIRDLLAAGAASSREAPALFDADGRALTYTGLLARADALAATLRENGARPGERIAIVLPNGIAMATAFLGASFAGAACPLNPGYRRAEIAFSLDDLHARVLVTSSSMDGPASAVARARGVRVVYIDEVCADGVAPTAEPACSDVALLLHTSGTTSKPKTVPLTHANLFASAANVARALHLSPADRCLNVMPLFHIHGLVGALLSSLFAGASVVCTAGFVAPEFFAQLRKHRPTWYTAVPTMHQSVLTLATGEPAPAPLRLVRSSSAALAPQTACALADLFGAPVIEAYGMTEAAHQMCSNPLGVGLARLGSVGLPAGPEVTILDTCGEQAPRGEIGEVAIRGANVTAGYAANPEANAAAFAGDWLRTGDLGRFDGDGYLYLEGRIKEIINRGGEKISPREIDDVLMEHPAVMQAVTFAIPDALLGEEVGAAVVLSPAKRVDERSLMLYAAERLVDFKVPRRIVILEELPKGPTGKVQRIGMAAVLGLGAGRSAPGGPAPAHASDRVPAHAGDSAFADAVASIWCEVLGLATVASDADFLSLGGDSVLAAQIIARVRARCRRQLSIIAFFDGPTLAAVAAAVARSPAVSDELGYAGRAV